MLKRSERLNRQQFSELGRSGKRFHCDVATISFTKHGHFHAAVVVSKKVSKSAVTRNTFRRRVYALLYQAKLAGQTGVFVVVVKPEAGAVSRAVFKETITDLIGRIQKGA